MLLRLQGLANAPTRSSPRAVAALVDRLGYVQIDSINVLERAHHLILGTRLDGYRHAHFSHPLEKSRALFEHWTHDACAIPTRWYPHWKHRFAKFDDRVRRNAWWQGRFKGKPETTLRRVLTRIDREGPLRARDFEPPQPREKGGWWEWHPEKAALEHLWRRGDLAIARRERFEKVYDLAERVHPAHHAAAQPPHDELVEWACGEAVARIGIGTATEIAHFFNAVSIADARAWVERALRAGTVVPVSVSPTLAAGKPVNAVAIAQWRTLASEVEHQDLRLLAPFDPVIRERARMERLFGFDFRFEAFVPAAKRQYGYYVLPMLWGDRLIGRIDLKHDRAAGQLVTLGCWWESTRRGGRLSRSTRQAPPTRAIASALERSLARLSSQIGAT